MAKKRARKRPPYNPKRLEARRLAERGGDVLDRGGDILDRGGDILDRGRSQAAVDIFKTAANLGGYLVIALVAPVAGFPAPSAGRVLRSEGARKTQAIRRKRPRPRRKRQRPTRR